MARARDSPRGRVSCHVAPIDPACPPHHATISPAPWGPASTNTCIQHFPLAAADPPKGRTSCPSYAIALARAEPPQLVIASWLPYPHRPRARGASPVPTATLSPSGPKPGTPRSHSVQAHRWPWTPQPSPYFPFRQWGMTPTVLHPMLRVNPAAFQRRASWMEGP